MKRTVIHFMAHVQSSGAATLRRILSGLVSLMAISYVSASHGGAQEYAGHYAFGCNASTLTLTIGLALPNSPVLQSVFPVRTYCGEYGHWLTDPPADLSDLPLPDGLNTVPRQQRWDDYQADLDSLRSRVYTDLGSTAGALEMAEAAVERADELNRSLYRGLPVSAQLSVYGDPFWSQFGYWSLYGYHELTDSPPLPYKYVQYTLQNGGYIYRANAGAWPSDGWSNGQAVAACTGGPVLAINGIIDYQSGFAYAAIWQATATFTCGIASSDGNYALSWINVDYKADIRGKRMY